MSQMYKPVPVEEDAVQSRDPSSENSDNEKWEWQRTTNTKRSSWRSLANSKWAWLVQAVMFSVSVTLFAVSMCKQMGGKAEQVPTTWCMSLSIAPDS